MWTFNVTRKLVKLAGYTVLPQEIPQDDESMLALAQQALSDTNEENRYILKVHKPISAKAPNSVVLTTLRDPRDVLVSYMRFMKQDFEPCLKAINQFTKLYDHFFDFPQDRLLLIRYSNITNSPEKVISSIADFLGLEVEKNAVEKVAKQLSKRRVQNLIQKSESSFQKKRKKGKAISPESYVQLRSGDIRIYDKTTGFQSGHVSNYQDGEWREIFDSSQLKQIENTLGVWLQNNGFA